MVADTKNKMSLLVSGLSQLTSKKRNIGDMDKAKMMTLCTIGGGREFEG